MQNIEIWTIVVVALKLENYKWIPSTQMEHL